MSNNLAIKEEYESDGLPMPRRVYAIIGIWCGIFLSVVNNSIANVSLPTIAANFSVEPSTVVWVINAYQLATIMLLLPFAALGEIFGYRKIYLIGIVIFSVSSLACALSANFPMLVAARLVQGVGSAFITCVNTTLVRLVYPKKQLGRGIGLNSSVVATSAAAGPAIAGALLMVCDWHYLFAVNVPFGVFSFLLGWFFLPRTQNRNKGQHFDFKSGFLSASTFGLLILSVESLSHGWCVSITVALATLFLFVAVAFVRSQMKVEFPILPIDLLRIPLFSLSIATSICSYLAQMMALISLPFFLQHILGYNESETGLLMTAWPLVIIFIAPMSGFLAERIHAGVMSSLGLSVFGCGLLLLFFIPDYPSPIDVVSRLMLCGFGFALFQSPNNSTIIASAPRSRSGSASGMLATARLFGQTTGASLVALIFLLNPVEGPKYTFAVGAGIAFLAALLSGSRLSFKSPLTTENAK
ncbi:MAG: MFS transporter [Paludibacteraceae bacterium]|nr:MFS transporter [Paludibacteraceae bacterium]